MDSQEVFIKQRLDRAELLRQANATLLSIDSLNFNYFYISLNLVMISLVDRRFKCKCIFSC